jgi:hypothetical protein
MFVYRSIIVLFSTNTTLIPVRWDEWKILSHLTENYNRAGSLPHMNTRCTDFLHWQWRVDLIQASSPVSSSPAPQLAAPQLYDNNNNNNSNNMP